MPGRRVLVGVEQERVRRRDQVEVDLGRRCASGGRWPVFCSNTISSWPQGMATRYWVLTPTKLTSVTRPPVSRLWPLLRRRLRPRWRRSSPAGCPARRDRPSTWLREPSTATFWPLQSIDHVVAGGVDHVGADQVGLAEEVRHERRRGVLVELAGRAHLLDHAVVHHRDGVGHGHGLLLVVGDVHEGDADLGLDPLELDLHLPAQLEVQRAQRLVEQQHAGLVDQGAAERDPLLLAAGELGGLAVARSR